MSRTPRRKPRRLAPPPQDGPVVRITSPAQVVAGLSVQLGYTPTESLVVVCCHEPRGRTGLTVRLDLPAPENEQHVVDYVEDIVRGQDATRVVLAVYTEEADGDERARERLVNLLMVAFRDLVVTEALLVRGGRFWSYQCADSRCCPPEGTPVDAAGGSAAVELLRLERLALGDAQLGTREDLERLLAGPSFLAQEAAAQRCDAAVDLLLDALAQDGVAAVRRRGLAQWEQALADARDPRWVLPEELAAALAVGLEDLLLRDAVAALWVEEDRALRHLLVRVVQQTPTEYAAPVCALLAWVTYCEGGGSITSIALDRALASDPEHSLAQLLRHALDNAFPPEFVRDVTRRTRKAVQQRLDDAA